METAIVIEVEPGRLSEVPTSRLYWGDTTNLEKNSEMRQTLELKGSADFCILQLPDGDYCWVEPVYSTPEKAVGEC